ncbi:MAG: alpha-galactosidase [Loktanella sp.]|nr:alpha-galactosidase [Loktanella sp.]
MRRPAQCWRLDCGRQSFVLTAVNDRLPQVVYWGPRLGDGADLSTLHVAHAIDVTGGMLDENPDLSLCPEATRTFPGQPGLILRDTDGTPLLPKFCFDSADTSDGLRLHYTDTANQLKLTFAFAIDPRTHVITAQTTLDADRPVHLHWLAAPVVPAPQQSDEMIDVAGRWIGEFQLNRTPWSAGMRYRENRTGRTGHEHFPGLIVPCTGATNTQGEAYAFHYGWSGGHRMIAEELPDGRRQIQWGHAARMETDTSRRFETAKLYMTYSGGGLNGILSAHEIDYIKWDHNRVLPMPDAAQTRGSYALIDRLRTAFPQIEIESCASGGGRIDFGIMERTQRVWLSDSNDALERLRIQHDGALFLPAAVTGSHVGPRHCHTSGRVLDIAFRAWVAAQRHMGFEMDPRELTDHEAQVLTRVTQWWKDNRHWMRHADILRLDSADPAVIAEQQLSRDGDRFVVFSGKARSSDQIAPRPLRLTRLDPDATYRVSLTNADDIPGLSRGMPALKDGPIDVSGTWLMHHGLVLPWSFPERMWVLEGEKL